MKSVQRIISMILALSLILEFCPQAALATETEQTQETEIAVTARETTLETTAPAEAVTEPVEETATPTEAATEPVEEITSHVEAEMVIIEELAETEDMITGGGTFGENQGLAWSLENGLLTICGNGRMNITGNAPWYDARESITSAIIHEGVTEIGYRAFADCTNLKSIELPGSAYIISNYAFTQCTALSSVEIPDGVTYIGQNIFTGCTSLKNIELPETIKRAIEYGAFQGCSSLETIIIPDGVTKIESGAFSGCVKLTSITIPKSVTEIGGGAFKDCASLKDIELPDNLVSIGGSAFYNCASLTSIVIPNTITKIESGTFSNCTNLTSVTIPKSVTSIGNSAFSECCKLTDVVLSTKVKSVGSYAFSVPVNYQGTTYAWEGIAGSSMEAICTNGTIVGWGNCGYSPELQQYTLKWNLVDGLLNIWGYGNMSNYSPTYPAPWYKHADRITRLRIEDGIPYIGEYAFYDLQELISVEIAEGITDINRYAFSSCTKLSEVSIPDSVVTIGDRLFEGCTKLRSVDLGQSITSIPAYAFSECSVLTGIVIPDSVTSIGAAAFMKCSSLTDIVIPDSVTAMVDVYNASLSTVNNIFSGCVNLRSVTLGEGITSIGNKMFATCNALSDITFSDNLISIGIGAFQNTSLTHFTVPDSVTTLGNAAFSGCSKLRNVTLGKGITSIGDNMFSWCSMLSKVSIPNTVTSIGQYAFSNCKSLNDIRIPEGVSNIGRGCFENCENLNWIVLPSSLYDLGDYVFKDCSLKDVYYSGSESSYAWNFKIVYHVPVSATVHFESTGPDIPEELPPAYDTEIEIIPGSAATPELNYLLNYLIDWLDAYDKWVSSVKEGLEDFGASDEESKEAIIRQEAERMRTHDQNTHSRYLTGQIEGYESQAYHALASFFYENIATEVPDISSVDLEKDLAGVNLVEMLRKNMYGSSDSYFYGNVTISICVFRSLSVNFGSMTIIDNKGSPTGVDDVMRTITICSDSNQIQQALTTYVGELQDLSINASFNIANAVVKDILGKSLTTLTSDYVNKAVAKIETKLVIKLVEKLGAAGVGKNLVSTLDECYTFYTWVKKCIDLGKQEDIDKALNNIINLKFEDTTVSKGVTKKAMKELRKAHSKMQRALREYLDGTLVEKEQGFWRWFFGCPVSISVYNSSGEQIGYVGEDDLWYTDDISITELGGVKEIVSFTEDELSFVVTATDYGTMSCMFEQYDEDFAPVGRLNYYNVILEPEQTFQVSVPETLEEENETAAITSGGEVIYPDEYISAEDSAGVTISCSAVTEDGITGGTVSGTGTYIRGDSVILRAEPYEGFRFVGWFDGEYLMGTETIYEFPARENCEISARFYKQKPILIQLEADVGGGAIGGGRYDSGETVTLIALPQSGYRFDGWYVGEELVSTDEEYSFQAAESLILHAAFLHTAVKGDLNEDGAADIQDAIYLIWNTLFPDLYPVTADADFNNDGIRNTDDAVILLWHAMFPEQYPLT